MFVDGFIAIPPSRTPAAINIGNFVWLDLDQDGIQDAGEPEFRAVRHT